MRLRPNRLTKVIALVLVGGIAISYLLVMLKRYDRDTQLAFVKKGATLVAAHSTDFYDKKRRVPRDLLELHNFIRIDPEGQFVPTGGLQQIFDFYDPEFYIDPRSNAKEACVWLRPRKGAERIWVEGRTDGWDLPPSPPPVDGLR
jgi:hypothetical protein